MAIFSILHLWAFAWQEYSTKRVQDVEATDFYGDSKTTYQGGFWGLKALLDALNPLDLLKAISRGLRWLFVGRKKRMQDPSYQVPSEQIGLDQAGNAPGTTTNTAYEGAGALMAGGRTSPDQEGDVLLSHAQPNPTAHGHSNSETGLVPPPAYDDEHHNQFYTSNSNDRLSNPSLLDPMAPSPQPYSPYDDSFHSPYMVPADHGDHEHDDLHHNPYHPEHFSQQEMGVTTGPYPSHGHEPIPMPQSYQPPPLHDDYDHGHRY